MNALLFIPEHSNCRNCGSCCGLIPADDREIKAIRTWLAKNPDVYPLIGPDSGIICPFRDDKQARCLIYRVRPLICRLYGVISGMECQHGNSAAIDPTPFKDGYPRGHVSLLNFIQWQPDAPKIPENDKVRKE